jgi:aspartate-semialdehyde dehydrogenase
MTRHKVGILGATGLVGQRLIERLANHPWFELVALAASDRSAGRPYVEAAQWRLPGSIPGDVARMTVRRADPAELEGCVLVFSALDTDVARELEPRFADRGFVVVSNSSAFRQGADVPLLVPEINASHVALIEEQRLRTGAGYIVTNPNCSITGLALALAPLHREFGLRRVVVTTLQAISGAGADGPRALDLTDNVLPYIAGEEEKMETELSKILGTVKDGGIDHEAIAVSAHCHRVPVIDGHLEAVSLEMGSEVRPEQAAQVLSRFAGDVVDLGLPSSVGRPIVVRSEPDRPQPRLDRDAGGGMSVTVGRLRPCSVLGLKLELLSHNTVRGAAGCTVLNAELLAARELIPERSGS